MFDIQEYRKELENALSLEAPDKQLKQLLSEDESYRKLLDMYFSLGQKEEKTRNRKMAAVGEMTRWQHEQVKDDGCVRYSELVWQNGGHFTDVEKRIAHGFAWLIDHAQG